jgi:capsular polysaccharide export protein
MAGQGRKFLFVQGLATPFFAALGQHLRRKGAETLRVNFCPGEEIHWRGPAIKSHGVRVELLSIRNTLFAQCKLTDFALFGSMHPLASLSTLLSAPFLAGAAGLETSADFPFSSCGNISDFS